MAGSGDYYSVLGLTKEASDADIKAAFRKLAHEVHPDRAGADPAAAEKFKAIREAYEALADPAKRAAYDRRNERRSSSSPFYGSHWKHAGSPAGGGYGNKATAAAGNDIDLEDIFNDFGGVDLGFGKKGAAKAAAAGAGPGARPRTNAKQWDPLRDFKEAAARDSWPGAGEGGGAPSEPAPGAPKRGFGFNDSGWSTKGGGRPAPPPPHAGHRRPDPEAGEDVRVNVNLSSALLGIGGLVTVEYDRNVRADDGASLLSIKELHELRVPPDVREGDELRVPKHGHAGAGGGPYGDLVATIHVVGAAPRMKMPRSEPSRAEDVIVVDVPFTEAILGGRVELDTPQGRVRVSIPAGTSSGSRFRLKGKGKADATGAAGDVYAEVRITVPKTLDEESRKLIEQFCALNPGE
ncbi:hypothetical protein LBMAG42_01990 [Deltaproteobacteria bacterium]|nr:hypothetical protein LBMAG42_01990 [Deltaproteobacteria bacterium]